MAEKWLQDWLAGKGEDRDSKPDTARMTADERAELARFDRLWEAANPPAPRPLEVDTDAAWSRLEGRLFEEEDLAEPARPTGRIVPMYRRRWLSIAAGLALVLAAGYFVVQGLGKEVPPTLLAYNTSAGESKTIELPDGTLIRLNQHSSLQYTGRTEDRQVELTGEAFFDVARDENRPFVITSGEVETRVLGTSFNVRAYPDKPIEVAVASGRVEVKDQDEAVVLVEDQSATYEPSTKSLSPALTTAVAADVWLEAELVFEGVSLGEVLPTLERYYSCTFKVLNEQMFTCLVDDVFQQNDLEGTLRTLEFTYFIEHETRDGVIYLSGAECASLE